MPDRKRAAGVVVLRREAGKWLCLLLRAYRNWDFPKGLIEPAETPREAAIREAREETGLEDLNFAWGDESRLTEPYGGGKIARYFLARTENAEVVLPVSEELGRPEHHEFRWTTFDEARRLVVPRLEPIIDWAEQLAGP